MQQPTIRLLTINDSASEAERLVSMLQNAGKSVRATHCESPEALTKLLQEKIWDLMIATESSEELTPVEALKIIRRQNKDIPLILLSDREGTQPCVEGIKLGARDVVKLDEDQHLLMVIDREINNRQERETRRSAERRFNDVVKRNQQLLDSSRDAIAFVQDGMFLYANESFAELLEYPDKDDLECLPVIDIVKKAQHDNLKSFLKNFMLKVDESESKKIKLTVILHEGGEKTVEFEIHKAVYDEESCIQFIFYPRSANTEALEAKIEEIKNLDTVTGLYNKAFLMDKLGDVIRKAEEKQFNSALFHIGIDKFQHTVTEKLGLGSVDNALATIAKFTQAQVKKTDVLCRFGEDSFILVAPKINAVQAQERSKELGQALRDYIVDVDGKTLRFNYHIGIAVINETSSNVDTPIDHSIQALSQARKESEKDPEVISSLFEPEEETGEGRNVSKMVQKALDNGKFKLLFQPILSLRGSEQEHYEVLLRMLDDDDKEVSPKEFLAEAASIQATSRIDRWVILEATKMLAQHRKAGANTQLIVHLSSDSMKDDSLVPWLSVVFRTAKLPPDAIVFQLNEVDINDHINDAKVFTAAVRELGAGVSVNHFGCALNPFKTLEDIQANYIKIDGSFTQDLQSNEDGVKVLNELVSELHQKDKITIVPFVENASLLSKLWQSGVHYIQGHYLQGPTDNMDYDFDMES